MRNRSLLLVIVLVVAVIGVFVYRSFSEMQKAAAAREQLFAAVTAILDAPRSSDADASRLVAGLLELGPEDHEAQLALARLELRRKRYERAIGYLETVVEAGGELELRTAAQAWFLHQASAAVDAGAQRQMLQQALSYGEQAAAQSHTAGDWFLCWQAASRLGSAESKLTASRGLQADAADSLEARTVALFDALGQEGSQMPSIETVTKLANEWDEAPLELQLLQAALLLEAQELERAMTLADNALLAAPNLFEVRQLAATVHHVAVQTSSGGERERHVSLRDAQIQWLDANAEADDARRPLWLAWKQVR